MSELEKSFYDLFLYIEYGVQDWEIENYKKTVEIIMRYIKKLIKDNEVIEDDLPF